MTKLIVKTGTEVDFFRRGRELAKAADRGEQLPAEHIISFEDPADLTRELQATAKRFSLRAEIA